MTREHDLLFAALAVKIGQIDQAQHAQACSDWFTDLSKPFAEILIERGWLTSDERRDVETLVDKKIQEHGGSVEAALESVRSSTQNSSSTKDPSEDKHDGVSEEAFMRTFVESTESSVDEGKVSRSETIDHPDIEKRGNSPERTFISEGIQSQDHHDQLKTVEYRGDTINRYTLSRVHGKGGLGRVWLAEDTNLKRDVALKEILPGKDSDRLTIHRLIKEAQITGQLEHPNIIPVYELGENPSSKAPFYTMKFLRGETLGEKIKEYHEHRKAGTATRLELRNLLSCFVNVCHAIAYAHSRGIIHRDLKPRNIMLGSFGEVLVLDWGLATLIGEVQEDVDIKSIKLGDQKGELATQDGVILGTPAYMAPEQANGQRSLMDERTDIYGLGAVLFCILTGRAPHRGERTGDPVKDTMSLIARIAHNPSPHVRDAIPEIPTSLGAICSKAMARNRADRFQTGTEIADEVSRWLADEPLTCYVESLPHRAFRWLRRHRQWAQAISTAVIVVAVTATLAALLINSARKQEVIARANEERAKQEAIVRFREARTTVDKSLTGISDVLTNFPGVESIRAELLQEAALDYERFATEQSDDPELQAESGVAWYRLAEVRRMLNRTEEAQDAYRRSIEILTALVKEYPINAEYAIHLATSQNLLAAWLTSLDGRVEEARSLFTTAELTLNQVVESETIHVKAYDALAALLLNRANLHTEIREHDLAALALQKARSVLETLIRHDASENHQRLLARTWWRTGRLLYQTGDSDGAIEALQNASNQFATLGRSHPDEPKNLEGLADAENDLGNALSESGKYLEAIRRFRRAVETFELLLEARPGVPAYLENVAVVQTNIAGLYLRNGHSRDAYDNCVEALKVLEFLTRKHEEIRRFHEQRATCSTILAMISRDLNDDDFALSAINAAAQEFSILAENIPEVTEYRRRLAVSLTAQARTLQKTGKLDEAANQFNESLTGLAEILELDDSDHVTRAAFAWCCLQFGTLMHEQGDTAAANDLFLRATQERERLMTDMPSAEQFHDFAFLLVHCPDTAFQDYEKAIELCDQAVSMVSGNAKYPSLKALALLRKGQFQECLDSASKAIARRGEFPHASDHFIVAMAHWKLNDTNAAKDSLIRANQLMDDQQPGNVELLALRHEAEQLIGSPESADDPEPQ